MRAYSHSRYPLPGAWETLATASRSQMALSYLKVEGLRVKYGEMVQGLSSLWCCTTMPWCACTKTHFSAAWHHVVKVGPGENDGQAATVIANHPVPSDCPLFYFEVEILNRFVHGMASTSFRKQQSWLAHG